MDCTQVLEKLCDFVDSELDAQTRKELRGHLESCDSCKEAYRELSGLKRLVQTKVYRHPIPGGLAARIVRQTRDSASGKKRGLGWRHPKALVAMAALFHLPGYYCGKLYAHLESRTLPGTRRSHRSHG